MLVLDYNASYSAKQKKKQMKISQTQVCHFE